MYKLLKDPISGQEDMVLHIPDNNFIPIAEANTDYKQYVAWLAAGNIPDPADPVLRL
ncbi:hypothetical protein [Methylobacter sp.]|uniref:hypothetical protein n=1 Tax=Methylobacter sp. TaxID=2051955 RepID=UPI002487E0CF|nr:hypothetical protein [Methylobacter sp.]MDI1278078.1 hypothetical protein [Methylobacter sp.]